MLLLNFGGEPRKIAPRITQSTLLLNIMSTWFKVITLIWHVSESPVLTILKATKVSKATGLDNWSGCFLKDEAKLLFKPITDLCNLSITSEKSPDSYIVAILKPLHKKGFLTLPCNYRPISLLTIIYKVTEKVVHEQASTFLNSRNLLYNYQSGFRKKHSTDLRLSYSNDKTGIILIDLKGYLRYKTITS